MTKNAPTQKTESFWSAMARVLLIFFVLTLWALFISLGYGYRNVDGTGLIGWIRLPQGMQPFAGLDLATADVVAFMALFVAIVLAATVQMNSTVAAADDIADRRPATPEEARQQQRDLQVYTNQAEMAMIVSFGSAFGALLLAMLFGLQEMSLGAVDSDSIDSHGVGWVHFAQTFNFLFHPRVTLLYFVAFLLFLITYASMPSWKNTGIFRRQVEDNAWQARKRLAEVAERHDLDNVQPIAHPVGATLATIIGYVLYVLLFVLTLNLSLTMIAGRDGFRSLLTLERWPMLFLLAIVAVMISTSIGSLMLRVHHLHARSNALVVISLVLTLFGVFYIVYAEGVTWAIALGIVVVIHGALWAFLYYRAVNILDEKDPAAWEFLLNPPKFIVMRRFEAIRRSAASISDDDDDILSKMAEQDA